MKKSFYSRVNMTKDLHGKFNESYLQYLIKKVEKATGLSIYELKQTYTQDQLFRVCLYHVTTTKKAIATAFDLPIENMCRRKRELEKSGLLVQSAKKVICPITKHPAHLISTNPAEFVRLSKLEPKKR